LLLEKWFRVVLRWNSISWKRLMVFSGRNCCDVYEFSGSSKIFRKPVKKSRWCVWIRLGGPLLYRLPSRFPALVVCTFFKASWRPDQRFQ
jgi:hypothetical protein